MKKRIISLILVVAMAFLTLTGCAYNYAKDDMSKYATIDSQKLYEALHALLIDDAKYAYDGDREAMIDDAIAEAILGVTDKTDKKFADTVGKYDILYFCYYATDANGNVFYADKMDESKATELQVGITTLKDLNKAISDKIPAEDIASYIYSTSSANVVGKYDVISLSYTKTWQDGVDEAGNPVIKTEEKSNHYFTVGDNNKLAEALLGKPVGVTLDEFKITEKIKVNEVETDVECTYKDVKVESMVKDNSTDKVADGDVAYITYTITFDATPWYDADAKEYKLPEGYNKDNVDSEGKYKATVSYEKNTIKADAEDATAEQKTFLGQLVGKSVGSTTSSITVKNALQNGDKTYDITYTNVKVNWIVNSTTEGFTVNYTPYEEELKDDKSNKKEVTNVYGEKITLNGEELTYHIFPVYYVDVEDVSAELIIREFYSTVASTETKEHDHTEEEHEHETEYVFATLNDTEFKNGDKTLADLVTELVTLYSTLTAKEKTLSEALKSLNTAQSEFAKLTDKATESDKSLKETNRVNAEKAYQTAKKEADDAEKKVDEMIPKILACKKGETTIDKGIVDDYRKYTKDNLEEGYKSDIKKALANAIIAYINDDKNVTYTGELPKKAVKNAYNAIMNEYKYYFYEDFIYSSSTSNLGTARTTSTSADAKTNYQQFDGVFNDYLIEKLFGKDSGKNMKDAKAEIQKKAEETVKDIILIYAFADAIEKNEEWKDADVLLTKEEKKEIKKSHKSMERLYRQFGLEYGVSLDDEYHSAQFDDVMDYLLEVKEPEEGATATKIEFVNINYDFNKPQEK